MRLKDKNELAWTAFRVCEEFNCKDEATKIYDEEWREINLCDKHMNRLKAEIYLP